MKEVSTRFGQLLAEIDKRWRRGWPRDREKLDDPAAEELRQVPMARLARRCAAGLDWGFLSLFPDRATQGEYQKLIKEVEKAAVKGPPRAMVLLETERPYEPRHLPPRSTQSARRLRAAQAPASPTRSASRSAAGAAGSSWPGRSSPSRTR